MRSRSAVRDRQGMSGLQGGADLGTAVWVRQGEGLRPEVPVLSNLCEKAGISKTSQITKMMQDFIDEQEKNGGK